MNEDVLIKALKSQVVFLNETLSNIKLTLLELEQRQKDNEWVPEHPPKIQDEN